MVFNAKNKKWELRSGYEKALRVLIRGEIARTLLPSSPDYPNILSYFILPTDAVILPYYCDPFKDMDYNFCRKNNIEVVRIPGGGGPYWLDSGSLLSGYSFRLSDVPDFPSDINETYKLIMPEIAKTLSSKLNIPFTYRPLNDLEVYGKKISGATHINDGKVFRAAYGPQVKEPKLDVMEKAIPPSPEKFADKEAKSIGERIGWIKKFVEREISMEEVAEAYIDAYKKIFDVEAVPGDLIEQEKKMIEEYERMLTSEDWILAMSEQKRFKDIPSDAKKGESIVKIPQGPLIRVTAFKKSDKIYNINITGSIHCTPFNLVEKMVAYLRGINVNEGEIRARVETAFKGGSIGGVKPEDFVAVIMKALKD